MKEINDLPLPTSCQILRVPVQGLSRRTRLAARHAQLTTHLSIHRSPVHSVLRSSRRENYAQLQLVCAMFSQQKKRKVTQITTHAGAQHGVMHACIRRASRFPLPGIKITIATSFDFLLLDSRRSRYIRSAFCRELRIGLFGYAAQILAYTRSVCCASGVACSCRVAEPVANAFFFDV